VNIGQKKQRETKSSYNKKENSKEQNKDQLNRRVCEVQFFLSEFSLHHPRLALFRKMESKRTTVK